MLAIRECVLTSKNAEGLFISCGLCMDEMRSSIQKGFSGSVLIKIVGELIISCDGDFSQKYVDFCRNILPFLNESISNPAENVVNRLIINIMAFIKSEQDVKNRKIFEKELQRSSEWFKRKKGLCSEWKVENCKNTHNILLHIGQYQIWKKYEGNEKIKEDVVKLAFQILTKLAGT